jgi:hypothetical protein
VIDGYLVNVLSSDAGDRLLVSRRAYDKVQQGGGVYWDYFLAEAGGIMGRERPRGLPPSSKQRVPGALIFSRAGIEPLG